MSIDLRPSLQRRHLAVAGVEQSSLTEQFPDPSDQGKVQRVVGSIAGMNIAGHEQAGRFRGRGHEFELGQVGTMVLAVTQLHQAPLGDGVVTITGGAIQADPLDRQFIDVTSGLPEIGFQAGPDRRVAESLEDQGEAIVGEVDGAERLARDGFEGMVQVGGPVADVALAVVGLGEDVGDPDGDEPAVGESLMERMCREMAIEDLGESQA